MRLSLSYVRRIGPLLLALAVPAFAACGGAPEATSWNPLKAQNGEFAEGLKAYGDSRWADAQKSFEEANRKEPSSEGHFDEGSALYKEQKLQDALDDYKKVLDTPDDNLKARAYFNIGNTQASAGNLEEAKAAYRRALEIRPDDVDARYNLEWAERAIEQKKQRQKQGDQGNKDDEKKDKDQKSDQKDQKDQKDESKKGPEQAKSDDKDQKKDQNDDQKKDQKDQQQAGQDQKKDGAGQDQKDQQAQEDQKDQKDQPGQQDQKQGSQDQKQGGQQQAGQAGKADDQDDKNGTNRPLGRQETAAVLDALQQGEKPLQMWKFDEKDRKATTRSARDKPW
jgi:tetratricopeptide (TPR) repeat protein